MELLYKGFDGLDVSFKAHIGKDFFRALEEAKREAQRLHHDVCLMDWGRPLMVGEGGAKGGYAYRASTGEFGATWFFKKPNERDPWGIRVSCASFNLAINGFSGARDLIYQSLACFGADVRDGDEAISRIDYAFDFLAPGFLLNPDHIIMHSSSGRTDHFEHDEQTARARANRVTSVTVGKMPGAQRIIYDKRAEVLRKGKAGWWEIWNAGREIPLDLNQPERSSVWRVELRAGKRHLKHWNIVTWHDLSLKLGDMMAAMIDAVRHVEPALDTNRSRWPDSLIWQSVRTEASRDFAHMCCGAAPSAVRTVQRDAHEQLLSRQMLGLLIARAAIQDIAPSQLVAFARNTGVEFADQIGADLARFKKRLFDSRGRYYVI